MKNFILPIIIYFTGILICADVIGQNSQLANIDDFILNEMEQVHKPGLNACIIKGDSIVWSGNYGYAILEDSLPVSDSTLFTICSISKSITAACVLQLWEDGLLDLDENINNFLPFPTPGMIWMVVFTFFANYENQSVLHVLLQDDSRHGQGFLHK